MKKLREWCKRLIEIGVTKQSDADERLMIKTINFSSVSLAFVCIVVCSVNVALEIYLNGLIYFAVALLLILNFIWVTQGRYYIAKLITIYPIFIIPFLNVLFQGYIPDHQYLGLIGITVLGIYLSTIILDPFSEANTYRFTIIFIFLFAVFYDAIFREIASTPPNISFLLDNYFVFKTTHLILLVITTALLYYLKQLLHNYQQTVKQQNILLLTINNSLEQQVQEKTKSIENSKTKIAELAFLTSHKMRSPISSILGMMKIINDENSYKMVKDVFPNLYQKALSMDEVIKEMNTKIQDELKQEK